MNDLQDFLARVAAWVGLGLNLLLRHWSVLLSTLVALFAIGASIYSIRANRMKERYLRAQDERSCRACKAGESVACPYPEHERPGWCEKRKPQFRRLLRHLVQ